MDLTHRFVVPAPIDVTWAAFNDLEGIAPCFPGATLTSVDADEFAGSVKIKLGPISMVYNGKGAFVERDEAQHRAVISAKGKDKRGNGTAGATVVAQMTPDGDGTAVEVTTDLSITGKPAQFGRGVIQDVSDKLLGQFVDCIAKRLGPAADTAAPAEPAAAPAAEAAPASADAAAAAPGAEAAPSDAAAPTAGPQQPTTPPPPRESAKPAELNLMSTVLPVLLKRYGVPLAGAAVVVAVVIWAGSRN